ncbi:phage distal tail protein [Actinophytocola oryzae]|uniref:Tail protein n=1 Tax=Actinophytocola oryzae TaxID=502181 RepID=A0A4V3FSK8_9PSEU|nr:phage tail domain-containing protein [Actinophytocola oryzae]TDV47851.1 tail protein [Actinophytocola oryzae]
MTSDLVLPVFTVDGWSGNVVDDEGVEWWVTREDGWASGPDVRLSLASRPQRDGGFDAESFRSVRVITLEGLAIAPDRDAKERAKNRMGAVLADGSTLSELTVRERTVVRRAMVRLSAGTKIVDRGPHGFEFSLQVTAPDPLRQAVEPRTARCGLPRPGPGVTFPLGFPLAFGEPVDGSLSMTNAGTAVAWPVWTITGPVNQPVIRNDSTGQRLAFSLRLAEGDTLTVDVAARTVTLGGASRRSMLLPGSTWFGLPPGTTAVGFDATDTTAAGTLAVSWRDSWI